MSTSPRIPSQTDKLHAAAKALIEAGLAPFSGGALGDYSLARTLLSTMFKHPILNIDPDLVQTALERVSVHDDTYETLDIVRLDMFSTLHDGNEDLTDGTLFDTGKLLERCNDVLARDYDGRFKLGFALYLNIPGGNFEVMVETDSGFVLGSAIKELHERGGEAWENWDVVLVNIYNDVNQRIQQGQEAPF